MKSSNVSTLWASFFSSLSLETDRICSLLLVSLVFAPLLFSIPPCVPCFVSSWAFILSVPSVRISLRAPDLSESLFLSAFSFPSFRARWRLRFFSPLLVYFPPLHPSHQLCVWESVRIWGVFLWFFCCFSSLCDIVCFGAPAVHLWYYRNGYKLHGFGSVLTSETWPQYAVTHTHTHTGPKFTQRKTHRKVFMKSNLCLGECSVI